MGLDGKDDQVLLQKIKGGDENSFRKIYDKYHKELYNLALKYLRDKELAEDAVHDIFVKLWNEKDKLYAGGSLSGFLFTSLKNHVLNMISKRKRKIKNKIKFKYKKEVDITTQDNIFLLSEYRQVYNNALDQLPDKRRQVFELRMKEGLNNQEVANYLNISIHTVKSQYYKATKFIKSYVRKHTKKNAS